VLAALGLGFAGTAVALVAAALLGGFMSTLYPVCVTHAHDRMPADRIVAVSGQLTLLSGLGSVIGPLTVRSWSSTDGMSSRQPPIFSANSSYSSSILNETRDLRPCENPYTEACPERSASTLLLRRSIERRPLHHGHTPGS
jgi:MFS family permease